MLNCSILLYLTTRVIKTTINTKQSKWLAQVIYAKDLKWTSPLTKCLHSNHSSFTQKFT